MTAVGFWYVGLFGLFVSTVGSVLLFFGTPADRLPYGRTPGNKFKEEENAIKHRALFSRFGFGLLMVGFILQFIAMTGQYPA